MYLESIQSRSRKLNRSHVFAIILSENVCLGIVLHNSKNNL